MKIKLEIYSCLFLFVLLFSACEKFLAKKSDQKLMVPQSIQDLQALMDNYLVMNEIEPSGGEISADDYYLNQANWEGIQEGQRRMHIWDKDNFYISTPNDWFNAYRVVYFSNTVIEKELSLSDVSNDATKSAFGQAYYHRGRAFFNLAVLFSKNYDSKTSGDDLGIPLRLDPDFNKPSVRANTEQTYQRIIKDLKTAVSLLPLKQITPLRPSKQAAYGLLARVYLSMNNYKDALLYADSCLRLPHQLIDYNSLNATLAYPISRFNVEVISEQVMTASAAINNGIAKINTQLYQTYASTDLRKSVFFRTNTDGSFAFKGSYENNLALFCGIATNEVYLMRAECKIRNGRVGEGIADLNTLLNMRHKKGTFEPYATDNQQDALDLVLLERRKELLMRGLRWLDVKRLNKLDAGLVLTRNLNGQVYSLPPNGDRYALPLPENLVGITGLQQNPR